MKITTRLNIQSGHSQSHTLPPCLLEANTTPPSAAVCRDDAAAPLFEVKCIIQEVRVRWIDADVGWRSAEPST